MNNQPIEYKKDSFDEYLGKKDHISASDIKNFLHSPKYYFYEKYERGQKDSKSHINIGSALHELLLEPELFYDHFAVSPKFDRRTKDGKAGFDLFELENEGKIIINENDMEMIRCMCESSLNNQTFIDLMRDSYRETSCYTIDERTGLKIKLRPDAMPQNRPIILDIKSCVDSSFKKFRSDLFNYGYFISSAFYCDYLNKENYVFGAIEKEQPYQLSLFMLSDEIVENGRTQYRMALDLIKWSYDNNFWCDYNQFEALKECYKLENLDSFEDIISNAEMISIIF
jgi:exodeoxyribonuclease VIII